LASNQTPADRYGKWPAGSQFLTYLRGCDDTDTRTDGSESAFTNAFPDPSMRIKIVAVKNKWVEPASGGWFCGQVYFVFADDPSKHVCELQMVYEAMESIRKKIANPAYAQYASNRSAKQLYDLWASSQNENQGEKASGKAMGAWRSSHARCSLAALQPCSPCRRSSGCTPCVWPAC